MCVYLDSRTHIMYTQLILDVIYYHQTTGVTSGRGLLPQLEVTGDEDMSDSKKESYILSQDEIEMYRKVWNELKE